MTATFAPVALPDTDRSVRVFETSLTPLLFHTPQDYLELDPSVKLQERGPDGIQSDISIRGTTFEQSLILLDGLRVNDPETGHLNLDISVPLAAVSRIEVLHGSGSTFYGSDAIGGAVNLITERPHTPSLRLSGGGGSFASIESSLLADYIGSRWALSLAGSRDASDGFMVDRGYHSNVGSAETWLITPLGTTTLLLGASDRPFGANQFYGPYASSERTKGWFGSVRQPLGKSTEADFAYRRHSDLFVLEVNDPAFYENNHVDSTLQGVLRRTTSLGRNSYLSYGAEGDGDTIRSTNLGRHARNQEAVYSSLDLRSLRRFSLSLGAREELFSGGDAVFSPSLAGAFWLGRGWRLRAAIGHAFRLPTYVDLYYSDPVTIGNPQLKPESAWSYEGGFTWNGLSRLSLSATGFALQQQNGIDYSKYSLADKWQATNVGNLTFTGAELEARVRVLRSQEMDLGYTGIRADRQAPAGLISEYAFNFASQNASFAWSGEFARQWTARMQVQVIERVGKTPYPLWNIAAARSTGRLRPYLRLLNLSNTGYQEIPGVPLPGRSAMAGVELNFTGR